MLLTLLLALAWLIVVGYAVSYLHTGRSASHDTLRWRRALDALDRQQSRRAPGNASVVVPAPRDPEVASAVNRAVPPTGSRRGSA